jgi:hypothetical protein
MRDFLGNLIARHTDAAPQIKPRLPSMFEPEDSHGGLDLAIEEKEATTPEEIETLRQPPRAAQPVGPSAVGGLDLAIEEEATTPEETETLRQPPRAAQPAGPPRVTERVRPIALPVLTVPAGEEKPSVKAGLNKPVFSLSPRETPTLPPPSQGGGEEGVKETNSTSNPRTLTLSQRERGINEGFPKPSAIPIAPVMGRLCHAPQKESTERTPSNPKATAEERPSVKKVSVYNGFC